ncbi:MAG TPA: 4Fe-4S binding protein [Gallicola sp.]|nr:4Fe-4S binding protein [Gallicola sp.]
MSMTVHETTVKNNLCVSCGICESVCPQKCIKPQFQYNQFIPVINSEKCTNCDICSDICSMHHKDFMKYAVLNGQSVENINWKAGYYKKSYIGFSLDPLIRLNSTSGGLITTIVKVLLEKSLYSKAFLVDDFNYRGIVSTKMFTKENSLEETSKSRYIPVSHREMIKYALANRNERLIIVATGCVVHTLLNVIEKFRLNRNNFLILGLFCDRTMNQNVYKYFQDYISDVGELDKLYFRTKERSGWPGNVKFVLNNGKAIFIPREVRMNIKEYFQLEACLYCVDKLNQFADISFGDNYTRKNSDSNGSNSIIVRTSMGEEVINYIKDEIELIDVELDIIMKSQHINERGLNLEFAKIFFMQNKVNLYPEIICEEHYDVANKLKKILALRRKNIQIGKIYPQGKKALQRKLMINSIKNKSRRFLKRLIKK